MENDLLTVKSLSERWSCTEYSIRKQVSEGTLKACNLPGAGMRFRLDYIMDLEGHKEIFEIKNYRKLKRDYKELEDKYEQLRTVLSSILAESSKVINL